MTSIYSTSGPPLNLPFWAIYLQAMVQRQAPWLLALLAPALVLATPPTCTNIDFEGAELAVSNLGGTRACCNFCSYDSSIMCCPAKDKAGGDVRMRAP